MVANLIWVGFMALAAVGLFSIAAVVAVRTNSRLSGWLIYIGVMALPMWVFIKFVSVAVVVLWGAPLMGLLNFLASFANTLRVKANGPDHSATFPGQTDEGDRAWREFQDRSRAAEAAAVATREIGRIRRERRAFVVEALKGGAK